MKYAPTTIDLTPDTEGSRAFAEFRVPKAWQVDLIYDAERHYQPQINQANATTVEISNALKAAGVTRDPQTGNFTYEAEETDLPITEVKILLRRYVDSLEHTGRVIRQRTVAKAAICLHQVSHESIEWPSIDIDTPFEAVLSGRVKQLKQLCQHDLLTLVNTYNRLQDNGFASLTETEVEVLKKPSPSE